MKKITTRSLLLLYVFLFSILAVISIVLSTAPRGPFEQYSLTSFDLFYYLPWFTWIAVFGFGGLLIILVVHDFDGLSPRFTYGLMVVSLLIIFIIFFGLPYLTEPLPRYWDSWIHGSLVNTITDTGHLKVGDNYYQCYPASFLFVSAIAQVAGVNGGSLLRILPIFLIIAFFLALVYALNEIVENPKVAIIASFVYGLSTYYLDFHFSPEMFGWILFFILIAMLVKQTQINKRSSSGSRRSFAAISLLVLLAIGMTHPVTQAIALLAILFLFVFRKSIWQGGKTPLTLVLLTAIIFAAWAAFFGTLFYSHILLDFKLAFQSVTSNLSNSYAISHIANVTIPYPIANLTYYRRSLYILAAITAVFGFILYRNKNKRKTIFLTALVCVGVLITSLSIFGILPIERSIELIFIPVSVFSAFLIVKKKKVGVAILIFLVATVPLNFVAYYWEEPYFMTYGWEVSSAQFISHNFHGVILSDYPESLIMAYYNGTFSRSYTNFYVTGTPPNIFNLTYITMNKVQVVYISQLSMLFAQINGQRVDKNLTVDSNFDCICSTYYSTVLYDQNYPAYATTTNP